jgi:hypothetical protein
VDLFALATLPTGADEAGDRHLRTSTGYGTTSSSRSAGRVVVSVYSSGAIGRLVPEDVIGLLRPERDRGAA